MVHSDKELHSGQLTLRIDEGQDAIETAEFMRKKTESRVGKARKDAEEAEDPETHQDIKNHIKVLEQNVKYWADVVEFLENVKKGQEVIAEEEAQAQNEAPAEEVAPEVNASAEASEEAAPEANGEEEKTADNKAVESENAQAEGLVDNQGNLINQNSVSFN